MIYEQSYFLIDRTEAFLHILTSFNPNNPLCWFDILSILQMRKHSKIREFTLSQMAGNHQEFA